MPKDPSLPWKIAGAAVLAQVFLAQAGHPWTLWPGLALAVWAVRGFAKLPPSSKEPAGLPPRWEALLFGGILFLALLLRGWELTSLPPGLPPDQGSMGLAALRILDGARPFFESYRSLVPEPLTPYLLAAWFKGMGAGGPAWAPLWALKTFFLALSLAAYPFIYWYFRQLAGPRPALLALFLLAISRLDWVLVHGSQPSVAVPFYLFGALAFFLFGLRKARSWPLAVSLLFAGAGLYSYQACKAIPFLLGILCVREVRRGTRGFLSWRHGVALGLGLLLLAAPLLTYMVRNGTAGKRESAEFVLTKVREEKSFAPLLRSWSGTLLMFNRQGDPNAAYNIDGTRMLDDGMGVLLLLGLGALWARRKERDGFQALAGGAVFLLPCLLSYVPATSHRLTGSLPFLCFAAAQAGLALWGYLKSTRLRPGIQVLGALSILSLMSAQELWTYYGRQVPGMAGRADTFQGSVILADRIREVRAGSGPPPRCILPMNSFRDPTLAFLTYPWRKDLDRFAWPEWVRRDRPTDRDYVFYFDATKKGAPLFLMSLFPGSRLSLLGNSFSEVRVPRASLAAAPGWTRGLRGEYFLPGSWEGPPHGLSVDPLIDFSTLGDFPVEDFRFRVRWRGELRVTSSGVHRFQALSSGRTGLWLDGKRVPMDQPVALGKGSHSLRLEFIMEEGFYPALHFIWKRPGEPGWEVVPPSAFGEPPSWVTQGSFAP